VLLTGLALPWNTSSLDARKPTDSRAQGRPYSLLYCRGGLDLETDEFIPLLFHHEGKEPLAQTNNGTLRLEDSDEGLTFEADLADTEFARQVIHNLGRRRYGVSVAAFVFVSLEPCN